MNTGRPIGERIRLSTCYAVGIMAREAELAICAVYYKEVRRDFIDGLHVWVMTRRALDVAIDQFDRSRRVPRLPARHQGCDQIRRIFDWQLQAERVRALQVRSEHVERLH